MKLFIGLNAPIYATTQYKALEKHLKLSFKSKNIAAFFKRESDFHITLQYLGEVAPANISKIDFLESITNKFMKQDLYITGMGSFPSWEKARGVWLGIKPNASLELLQADVRAACIERGFKADERPFVPHITVASFPSPASVMSAMGNVQQMFAHFELQPDAINLYQSEKEQFGGSRYKILKTIPLADPIVFSG